MSAHHAPGPCGAEPIDDWIDDPTFARIEREAAQIENALLVAHWALITFVFGVLALDALGVW